MTIKRLFLLVAVFLIAGATGYLLFSGKTNKEPFNAPLVQKEETGEKTMDIAVYYVKYTEKDTFLVREIHTVPYTESVAAAAIKELITAPPLTAGAVRVLPSDTRLLGINIDDGLATVNFSGEVLKANVGSQGEALGIQSIVNTLTEFPQIKRVSFQVNGKLDSRDMDWWGHVGLYGQPFARNLEMVYEPAIWVTHPLKGQVTGVPLLVEGSARVFEGKVNARLLDQNGKVIAEKSAAATKGAPERGNFEIKITFVPPGKGTGTLEIFSGSPVAPKDIVKIPVLWP